MDQAGYAALTRQSGLLRELQVIANNVANTATTGYREEGIIFSEFVEKLGKGQEALSMAAAQVQTTSMALGTLTKTGGTFDFAIEGEGFFAVQTPNGQRLTRAGTFAATAEGAVVTPLGESLLDPGGTPIFVPPGDVFLSSDGTISTAEGPIAQIGVFQPVNPLGLKREDGVKFHAPQGFEPIEDGRVLQGFLEDSNVQAVTQLARMIEVQRAYETGQSLLDAEDERIRSVVNTLTRT